MVKAFGITVAAIALLAAGFFGIHWYIYQEKQGDGSAGVVPYRGELSGEYACVPQNGKIPGENEECLLGLKTNAGEYYLIDFNLMSQTPPEMKKGDQVSANGMITPIEMLSTDHWQSYELKGIFSVTDSLNVE